MDWDTVPVANQNGIILIYTVAYKALPDESPQSAVVSAPTTEMNLTGLMKYRNYSITVFASTAKGNGNASEPIIIITDEDSKLSTMPVHCHKQMIKQLTELKQATRNGDVSNRIAEHHLQTKHQID